MLGWKYGFQYSWWMLRVYIRPPKTKNQHSVILYRIGLLICLLGCGLSVFYVWRNIWLYATRKSIQMLLIVPGYNVAWRLIPLMFAAIIISAGFHELGHAICAQRLGIPVNEIGVVLMGGIVPAAYVAMPENILKRQRVLDQLMIYTAGVWHNCILACLSLILMYGLTSIFTRKTERVLIRSIVPNSVFADDLIVGEQIYAINSCLLKSKEDWYQCLQWNGKSFCEPKHVKGCGEIGVVGEECFVNSQGNEFAFLARDMILQQNCTTHCVCCSLKNPEESLLSLYTDSHQSKPLVFIGNSQILASTIQIQDFEPVGIPLPITELMHHFFHFIFIFCFALGILNLLPIYQMDGYKLYEIIFPKCVVKPFSIVMTVSLVVNLLMAIQETFL